MRFFVISDIHGSLTAFKRVMEAFRREGADYLVCAGDYLNHGPRNPIPDGYDPKEVAPLINSFKMKILGVRGNCDSEVDQMLLEFPCTSDYLIFFSEKRRCFVTHGHLYTDGNHPPLAEGDVFIYGHTHVPVLEKKEGLIFLNPGSISLPKDGSEAGYAILDASGIYLKTLDGTELSRLDF